MSTWKVVITQTLIAQSPLSRSSNLGCALFSWCHHKAMRDDIALKLCVVIHVLEDLLLNAMEGNNISDLQGRRVLLYQIINEVC